MAEVLSNRPLVAYLLSNRSLVTDVLSNRPLVDSLLSNGPGKPGEGKSGGGGFRRVRFRSSVAVTRPFCGLVRREPWSTEGIMVRISEGGAS